MFFRVAYSFAVGYHAVCLFVDVLACANEWFHEVVDVFAVADNALANEFEPVCVAKTFRGDGFAWGVWFARVEWRKAEYGKGWNSDAWCGVFRAWWGKFVDLREEVCSCVLHGCPCACSACSAVLCDVFEFLEVVFNVGASANECAVALFFIVGWEGKGEFAWSRGWAVKACSEQVWEGNFVREWVNVWPFSSDGQGTNSGDSCSFRERYASCFFVAVLAF